MIRNRAHKVSEHYQLLRGQNCTKVQVRHSESVHSATAVVKFVLLTPHAKISSVKKRTVHPAKTLSGGVEPPGDKSISHRYAMIAALAEGASELRHFAAAADCHSTLDCMKALGAEIKINKDTVHITGHGLR